MTVVYGKEIPSPPPHMEKSAGDTVCVSTDVDPKLEMFIDAVKDNDVHKVKTLRHKNKKFDVNTRDPRDPAAPTALIVACEHGSTDVVRQLLTASKGRCVDVNEENKAGRRPIWIAALHGNAEITDLLLNSKSTECDVNFLDKQTGCPPLYRAVMSNAAECVRLLVHAKADVNMRRMASDVRAETPLIIAVQMDNMQICEHLVNGLCKLQARTEDGLTALHYAVAYRRQHIAQFLLDSGIQIHAKSNNGVTAMSVAIEQNNAAMTRLLVEYGYKADKRYKWKETPLSQAIDLHSEECAMTLVHQGCSLTKKRGRSYFYMAVNAKLMRLTKFMAAVYPRFLQEEWIRQDQWPVSIYRRADIIAWLQRETRHVNTLRQLCRSKIFRILGKYPTHKLKKLEAPPTILKYLSYPSYIKDAFYIAQPLNTKAECPIDCPAICSRRYCPPIEVSSSSESEWSVENDEQ